MHKLESPAMMKKVLEILDRDLVQRLISEKDIYGENVCDRLLGLACYEENSGPKGKAAGNWVLLMDYTNN